MTVRATLSQLSASISARLCAVAVGLSLVIAPASAQTVSNTANVAAPAGVTDSNPNNNSATDTDTLQAQLTIVKRVTNDNGGTATVAGFGITTNAGALIFGSNSGTATNAIYTATALNVAAGTYTLVESDVSGYAEGTWSCSGTGASGVIGTFNGGSVTLAAGAQVTCSITNDDQGAALTLRKTVVNDNGGTALNTAWTLTAVGPTTINGTDGAAAVTNATVNPGTYALSESGGPAGYAASAYSCSINGGAAASGNSVTLLAGQAAVCTITNDDQFARLVLTKTVASVTDTNGNGINDAGDVINWTFRVQNTGTAAATNVAIADTLAGVTVSGGPLASLAAGAEDTTTFTARYTIQAADVPNNVVNSATATGTGPGNTPVASPPSTTTTKTEAPSSPLRVTKTAMPRDVRAGDLVRYTVTIQNLGAADTVDATLIDTPPPGFTYVDGTLTVADRDGAGRLAGTYPIRVDQIDIAAGGKATLVYLLRVGAGVRAGIHANSAFAQDGDIRSNTAVAEVQLVGDPLLDETLVLGTVYDDRDGDGWQDSANLTGMRVQGGFAPDAYVPNSTTVDRGSGMRGEADASSPMLHGILLGKLSARQSDADPVEAHRMIVRQTLTSARFTDDFVLTSDQGLVYRMNAAGEVTAERNGDAAKGLTGADLMIERKVSQAQDGVVVDYIITNRGVDERGIPGVRVASVEGLISETDQFGRYHLVGIPGGRWERGRNFVLKIDTATLPQGATLTTDNPLLRRITPGIPVRFDFGVALPDGKIGGGKVVAEVELGEVIFAPRSARIRPGAEVALDRIAEQMREHEGGEVVISANGESHALAYERAKAVQHALAGRVGAAAAATIVTLRAEVSDPETRVVTLADKPLLGEIFFDTDMTAIRAEYVPIIAAIAADIEQAGGGIVGIVGHADRRGSDAYNVDLAMRRSKAVFEAIAGRLTPQTRARLRVEVSGNPQTPLGMRGQ